MFLALAHTKLDVFKVSREFVLNCYKDLAEGSSRKSLQERKRYYEISRGSIIEVDTAFDIAVGLEYTSKEKLGNTGSLLIRTFQMLSKMIGQTHVE